MVRKTYVIDLDGTLLKSDPKVIKVCPTCARTRYPVVTVVRDQVDAVNRLYQAGHTIIIWTSRAWDIYNVTVEQLRRMGLRYHELYMGKPAGIYVDADALRSLE